MKMRLLAAWLGTMAVSVPLTLLALDYMSEEQLPPGAIRRTMTSGVLGEERELIVHLPDSYGREPQHRYAVLYVLDGSSQDLHTANTAGIMARIEAMPEVIVVGLPNVSAAGRQRDYTPPFMLEEVEPPGTMMGQADRFLAFLEEEVIPLVEREYRTAPFRMLAGHSRGGLLVCYSLIAAPGLFHARFAHSPALWREDAVLVTRLSAMLKDRPGLDTFLYLSIGGEENDKMLDGFNRARAALAEAAGPRLRWQADVVSGAVHLTNPVLATPLGFKALYADSGAGTAVQTR